MKARALMFVLVLLSLFGCRSGQLGHDQGNMRDTLLGLYEHQVVDNLIRTKLKHPIIQVDYNNLTGTLTQVASGNVGGSETTVYNTPRGIIGAFLRKAATSVLNYSLGASQTQALTMTGQPVIAVDSVYKAYVDAIQRDADIVMKATKEVMTTTGALKPDVYHIQHRFSGELWYVPTEKKEAFFKVYLDTTVLRQTKIPISLEVKTSILFTAKIEAVKPIGDLYRLELVLKDKIPNDAGQITIPVNGIGKRFRYQAVEDADTGQLKVALGQLTDRISLLYSQKAERPEEEPRPLPVEEFAKAIAGKDVTLKNDTFVAGYVPALRNQLEEIRSQDELIRLQQFGR